MKNHIGTSLFYKLVRDVWLWFWLRSEIFLQWFPPQNTTGLGGDGLGHM